MPLILSLGAFAMSGFTFYDQYLRKEVDLWLQVPTAEIGWRTRSDQGYFPRVTAVLINRGNVPTIVHRMQLHPASGDGPDDVCAIAETAVGARWLRVATAAGDVASPGTLVIKPGEPVVTTLEFQYFKPTAVTVQKGFCLALEYLSASGHVQRSRVSLRGPLPLETVVAFPSDPVRLINDGTQVIEASR